MHDAGDRTPVSWQERVPSGHHVRCPSTPLPTTPRSSLSRSHPPTLMDSGQRGRGLNSANWRLVAKSWSTHCCSITRAWPAIATTGVFVWPATSTLVEYWAGTADLSSLSTQAGTASARSLRIRGRGPCAFWQVNTSPRSSLSMVGGSLHDRAPRCSTTGHGTPRCRRRGRRSARDSGCDRGRPRRAAKATSRARQNRRSAQGYWTVSRRQRRLRVGSGQRLVGPSSGGSPFDRRQRSRDAEPRSAGSLQPSRPNHPTAPRSCRFL